MPARDDAPDREPVWSEEEEFGVDVQPVRRRGPELDEDFRPDHGTDVSEVRLDDPEGWLYVRPPPEWLITSGYQDTEVRTIRSGKEAEVVLVRRTAGERSHLLARKRYRPRAQRAFRREETYRQGQSLGDDRVDRAVAARTGFGRQILEYAWAYREFPVMRTAWELGVSVPYPVDATDDGLVMEYLGDEDDAAPPLVDIRLPPAEAQRCFEAVVEDVRRLLDAFLVHADLSAYNILWWRERPWLIDLPQAVDVTHPMGVDLLRRDLDNLCAHFRRWGVERDPGELFDDVLRTSPVRWPG